MISKTSRQNTLKVAVLATVVDYGGAEKVVISLMKNINSNLFDLVPIIFTRSTHINSVFHQELHKVKKIYHNIFVDKYKIKYLNPLINIIDALNVLKKQNCDLIHTHGYRADVIGVILSKLTGLPIITTCHGFISNSINLKLYNRLDFFSLRFVDKIIAVSDSIKSCLIKGGLKESRIDVIHNAVKTDMDYVAFNRSRQQIRISAGIKEKEFVIGYIGRLSEEKGLEYLVKAVSMMKGSDIPIRVLLIGDGPHKTYLENLVKREDVQSIVTFNGFQTDVENWLATLDIFILPSLTEGLPMSLLEAMSCGIPVVSSAVGGVPQVIESGRNGILISPGKPDDIRDAVYNLYTDELLRRKLSAGARETVRLKYNVKDWVGKIESEYLKLLERV